jgi:hypothetical protein
MPRCSFRVNEMREWRSSSHAGRPGKLRGEEGMAATVLLLAGQRHTLAGAVLDRSVVTLAENARGDALSLGALLGSTAQRRAWGVVHVDRAPWLGTVQTNEAPAAVTARASKVDFSGLEVPRDAPQSVCGGG